MRPEKASRLLDESVLATHLIEADGPEHQSLVAAEISDLWQGDVPYFSARAGYREVTSSRGETLQVRPDASGLELALRRLDSLGDADLARQCRLIELTLKMADNRARPEALLLLHPDDPFDLHVAARAIAETAAEVICAQAIFDPDRQRATWLTVGEAEGVATVEDADCSGVV